MDKGVNILKGFIKGLCVLLFFILRFPTNALLQEKKGVEELIRELQADNPLLRRDAAEELGKAGDAAGLDPLLKALQDQEAGVRREAVKALGEIGDPRAVKPLGGVLDDPDEFVRVNAIDALERIRGDEAVDLIVSCLKNANPLVRISASVSLGRIGDKKTIPSLEEVAKNDPRAYVRFAAEQALVQLRGEAMVKAPEKETIQRIVVDERSIPLLTESAQVAERIQRDYGLVLDYKKYDIMDLLDIEARMKMRYSGDTMESLLGDLLTQEDKERNRHLFESKK
jgi:HEAT repeat protein